MKIQKRSERKNVRVNNVCGKKLFFSYKIPPPPKTPPPTVLCDPLLSELKELMEIDLEGNPFKDKKIHKILEGGYFAAGFFFECILGGFILREGIMIFLDEEKASTPPLFKTGPFFPPSISFHSSISIILFFVQKKTSNYCGAQHCGRR